jgi:hypothetical protein
MDQQTVKFLLIPTDGPWDTIFYMCGRCAHAIKLRDVEEHAKTEHNADAVQLYKKADDANAQA